MDEQESRDYYNELQSELNSLARENKQLQNAQLSMYGLPADDNLIKYQLDLKEDLDRIYHLLKGDQIKEDKDGNVGYVSPEDEDLKPFNEFGTQLIMNTMSFYLNRNTLLSNYDTDTINYKVFDFGTEIIDLIFNRYEEMMMTTNFEKEFMKIYKKPLKKGKEGRFYYVDKDGLRRNLSDRQVEIINFRLQDHLAGKMKMYLIIVRELIDVVHSAYLRAYHGGERDSLRTARTVTQSVSDGRMMQGPVVGGGGNQSKKFSLLNPTTWGRR